MKGFVFKRFHSCLYIIILIYHLYCNGMRTTIIILCFCLCSIGLQAQISLIAPNGARGIALGNIHQSHDQVDGIYGNPASLAWMNANGINVSFQKVFAELDLQLMQAGFVYGNNTMGTFGLQLISYGIKEYKEQKVGISYSKKLLNLLSIGAEFNLISLRADKYGTKIVPSASLGLYSKLSNNLYLATSLFNIIPVTLADDEQIPFAMSFGLNYMISNKVMLHTEFFKSIDQKPNVKLGMSYKFHELIAVQIGLNTNPSIISVGASYQMSQKFNANLASSYHPILGLSPAGSINFQTPQNNN